MNTEQKPAHGVGCWRSSEPQPEGSICLPCIGEHAAAVERARIVAWLRGSTIPLGHLFGDTSVLTTVLHEAANAIERGDHEK